MTGEDDIHPKYQRADELTNLVIGAAIEVHRGMGPGLQERIYERCLLYELECRGIPALRQQVVRIAYKKLVFDEELRLDLLVDGCLLLELKALQEVLPIHKAQAISYMKLLDAPLGLIINFHELRLVDGIHRLLLPGANLD